MKYNKLEFKFEFEFAVNSQVGGVCEPRGMSLSYLVAGW